MPFDWFVFELHRIIISLDEYFFIIEVYFWLKMSCKNIDYLVFNGHIKLKFRRT